MRSNMSLAELQMEEGVRSQVGSTGPCFGNVPVGSRPIGIIEFDAALLKADNAIIQRFTINPAYSEFAYGPWGTSMLWNWSGNKDDGESREYKGHAQPTEYGQQLRYLTSLMCETFKIEYLKSARIFSASNGGLIIPHVDYRETKYGFTRLHLPTQTYDYCLNSEAEMVYHMQCGEIWFLDGTIPHSGGCLGRGSGYTLCLTLIRQSPCLSCSRIPYATCR